METIIPLGSYMPQPKRNPPWKREELILALDLYFRNSPHGLDDEHPDVIQLSNVLKTMGSHDIVNNYDNYRSPNSVSLKLQNFRALDPTSMGKGMPHGSKMDKQIWNEFSHNRSSLRETAQGIMQKYHR